MNNYYSFVLHDFVHALDKYADEYLRENFGISYSRFLCLAMIYKAMPATQHEIAIQMQVDDAVVSRMLAPLAKENYVSVVVDPAHGRRRIVNLTSRGLELVSKASEHLEAEYLSLFKMAKVDADGLHSSVKDLHNILK